jgi:hypothetical protein
VFFLVDLQIYSCVFVSLHEHDIIVIIKLKISCPSNLKALTFQNLCHQTVGTLTCITSHELWLAI